MVMCACPEISGPTDPGQLWCRRLKTTSSSAFLHRYRKPSVSFNNTSYKAIF